MGAGHVLMVMIQDFIQEIGRCGINLEFVGSLSPLPIPSRPPFLPCGVQNFLTELSDQAHDLALSNIVCLDGFWHF